MNHDETNLNSKPDPELQTWIEPELEARIVAWVAGEASPFEVAELERLMAAKPELAIFKRRIEAVHGLVAEALTPEREPLRLSVERRTKLLATLGAKSTTPASGAPKIIVARPSVSKPSWWSWRAPRLYFALSGVAAVLLIGVFILPGLMVGQKRAFDREIAAEARDREAIFRTAQIAQAAANENQSRLARRPKEQRGNVADASVADPIVKLDAFTVSEPRDAGAVGLAATSASPAVPVMSPPPPIGSAGKGALALTLGAPANGAPSSTDDRLASASQDFRFGDVIAGGRAGVVSTDQLAAQGAFVPPPETSALFNERRAGFVTLNSPATEGSVESKPASNTKSPAPQSLRFGGGGSTVTSSVTLGERTSELSQAGSSTQANSSAATFGSSIAGGAIAPMTPAKEETLTLSAFVVSGSKQKDADRASAGASDGNSVADSVRDVSAIGLDKTAAVKVAAIEPPKANEFQTSGLELEEAKKKLAAAGERLKKLREERAVALQTKPLRDAAPAASKPSTQTASAETNAAKEPVSTFSLHVSDVSFRLAGAAVAAIDRGETPSNVEIRPEEFYNAFDYGDPAPAVSEKIGARIEQSAHPFLQQRNLLRIALKVPATGRGAGQPLRLTVLLDTSGSMVRDDRRLAVQRALRELTTLLGPNDRVTLIGFARQPRLLAEAVPGDRAGSLLDLSAQTPAEGGTNLEEALKLASELALRHRLERAQNRIVLLTDGAANLGNANAEQLARHVDTLRQQGIAFDACGIGLEGVGDTILEALTRKGDGRYYVIDRPETADAAFARQLAGAFRPAAENVKLQVRFNPARVGNYRLIGFESHRLREQDFRNDQVDAAELAAEEAANALYQIEVLPQGSGEIGEVFVRFRDAATGEMVERSWTIRYDPQAPRFDRATRSLQLAGMAALVAEKLGETALAPQFKLGDFAAVVNTLRAAYPHEARVQELVTMFGRMRRIIRE